jgi:hypothetical protein
MNLRTLSAAILLTGCSVHTEIVAPTATVPISLSRSVRDASGAIVEPERRETVGHFRVHRDAWAMLYTAVQLDTKTDISRDVNDQVRAAGGDAIVRMSIHSRPCAFQFVGILNWLPFWPSCLDVVVEGDIIRVRREEAKR